MTLHAPTRRELLLASGTLFAWAYLPKLALAEGRDPRLLAIVLRGALDGLAAVAPVGDPDWASLRGDKALTLDGKTPALAARRFFALNPAMPNLHRLYKAGAATIVHAAATPYRERSHFDGQDVLESGLAQAGRGSTPAGSTARWRRWSPPIAPIRAPATRSRSGRLRRWWCAAPAPVLSWTPPRLPPASDDTLMRLLDLYRHTDPALARVLEERMGLAAIARAGGMEPGAPNAQPRGAAAAGARLFRRIGRRRGEASWRGPTGRASARSPSTAGTPTPTKARSTAGWPRCSARSTAPSRRSRPTWARLGARPSSASSPSSAAPRASTAPTAPTMAPPRSRSWPAARSRAAAWSPIGRACSEADLHEGRDLKPTTDLRAVLKGLLQDHLRVDEQALATRVFPDSAAVTPMAGLLA